MANRVERVAFFPRYTSLVGPATGETVFCSPPVQARNFASVIIPSWIGTTQGGTYNFALEGSADLAAWIELADAITSDPSVEHELDSEWVRVKATLSEERFTCWVLGDFTVREA